MTFVLSILLIVVVVFACVCLRLSAKLDNAIGYIVLLETEVKYLEQSEKTLRESVNLQTKCIRDLNDIVKKSVENKEPTEPDTKALLAGWTVEEPELPREQAQQIDIFIMSKLVNSLHYKNVTPLYPWQQSELNQILGSYGIREDRMNQ